MFHKVLAAMERHGGLPRKRGPVVIGFAASQLRSDLCDRIVEDGTLRAEAFAANLLVPAWKSSQKKPNEEGL